MYFLNLDKLKIEKNGSCLSQGFTLPDLKDKSLVEIKQICDENLTLENLKKSENLAADFFLFQVHIDNTDSLNTAATDEEASDFLVWVNVIASSFLRKLTTPSRRKRDYRLDVPENLKVTNISLGVLKDAINYITLKDKFNLKIKYKDLIYLLVDKDKDKDKNESEEKN